MLVMSALNTEETLSILPWFLRSFQLKNKKEINKECTDLSLDVCLCLGVCVRLCMWVWCIIPNRCEQKRIRGECRLALGVCTFEKCPEMLSNLLLTAHVPAAKRKNGGGNMESEKCGELRRSQARRRD